MQIETLRRRGGWLTILRGVLVVVVAGCTAGCGTGPEPSPARTAAPAASTPAVTHPLDALTADEIAAASAILREAGRADDRTLFASISLEEPLKADVLAWQPGQPSARAARAIMRHDGRTSEAVVDLTGRKVASFNEVEGQPFVTVREIEGAIEAATGDARMRAGLERRGITDPSALFCAPRTVGNFGDPAERTRRLVKVDCFDTRGATVNLFAKPIEGLFATVDLDRQEVLAVTDLGVVPIHTGNAELDPASVGPQQTTHPIVPTLPAGGNISIDHSVVRWQRWTFHVRWDIRAGIVLSLVRFGDGDRARSVLYQGSLAEIFVPYQDPTEGWYYRNYLDEGDYGFGTMASALVPGSDCPATATFLSPVISNAGGTADTLDNRVCIFERAPGEPAWRHTEFMSGATESRPALELIVRYIATVGNYDYVLDWVLDQKGNITYRGGATGIDSVKGVKAQTLSDASAAEDTAWGPLVAPGLAGIFHDHFFSIRLGLDVDGPDNSFMAARLVPQQLPTGPRRSIWRVEEDVAQTDTDARFRLNYERPAMWHVVNPSRTNALGYPTGYRLQAAGNALPLVSEKDSPLSRAQFATAHLWVTPYDRNERWAAGDYPNQAGPGEGLPRWTANHRNIENTDIVLWYTMGFHHLPSAEDWPVYNLGWHSVTLRPYQFFDRNPALDLAPVSAPGR
jgi:primary-amine oxidase